MHTINSDDSTQQHTIEQKQKQMMGELTNVNFPAGKYPQNGKCQTWLLVSFKRRTTARPDVPTKERVA